MAVGERPHAQRGRLRCLDGAISDYLVTRLTDNPATGSPRLASPELWIGGGG
jgi:hypothetical protein